MILVSIVVPVYNVSKYLSNTINSLLNQDLSNLEYEILLVNDGSTDNSLQICESFKTGNPNITVIDKINGGVSSARNLGLVNAKGSYVMFIDGDDCLESNTLSILYDAIHSNNLDLMSFNYKNAKSVANTIPSAKIDTIVTGAELYFHSRKTTVDSSCTIIYNRKFLMGHDLKYSQKIAFLEDGEFLIRVMSLAERAAFLNLPCYIRTYRENSATSSNLINSKRTFEGYLAAIQSLTSFKKKHFSDQKKGVKVVNQGLIKFITHAIFNSLYNKSASQLKALKKELRNLSINTIDPLGMNDEYKFFARLFNIHINLLVFHVAFRHLTSLIKSKF